MRDISRKGRTAIKKRIIQASSKGCKHAKYMTMMKTNTSASSAASASSIFP